MKRTRLAATAAAAAALAATTVTTASADSPSTATSAAATAATAHGTLGTLGTGEVIPYPGPDGLIWIPEWIGDGGAATGGASPAGLPVTIAFACLTTDAPAEARVTFTAQYGDPTPVTFTTPCLPGTTTTATATVTPEQGRSFYIGIQTSAPDVHWGLTVSQPES
ncbi:hypothetical protein AB0O31_27900 [Kitasatospora cineracea]|uniref:hypothetical protein n=1 Tax=Kitasatospora cineracea TaxID=88074 RepID=UPI00343CB37C